jgi:hypothetical protein
METSMDITYEHVAPHLKRASAYHARRNRRQYQLHKHDGHAVFWRFAIAGLLLFWAFTAYAIWNLS